MKEKYLVGIIVLISTALLLYGANSLSIRYEEAQIFFEGTSLVHYIINFSAKIFGQNDFAIRLPFILLHVSSLLLLYKIGKVFLKRKLDRVVSIALYAMLPGVNSAALVVNEVYIVIFLVLLFVFLYMYNYKNASYLVLLISVFCDNSFAVLYLSLFFFSIFEKEKRLLVISLILFGMSMYMYGFDTGGKPKGYFLDALGVYAAIFSPLLFIYFLYALYRILIKEEKNLLWYISFSTLMISLVLSLRQKLAMENFAPFVAISIPLMVKVFFNSYRVRLPVHRKYHNIAIGVVFTFLTVILVFSFFNKPLYYFLEKSNDHFAYRYHIVKDLAKELKQRGVYSVNTYNEHLALRLKFYDIKSGGPYHITNINVEKENKEQINIEYFGKKIDTYYLYM